MVSLRKVLLQFEEIQSGTASVKTYLKCGKHYGRKEEKDCKGQHTEAQLALLI